MRAPARDGYPRPPDFLAAALRGRGIEPATFAGPSERSRAALRMVAGDPEGVPELPEREHEAEGAARAAHSRADAAVAAQVAERLAGAVERMRLTAERLAAEARADALEVAFLVARRILETEVSTGGEPLVGLVRSALRKLGESRRITIRLSAPDAEAVGAVLAARGPAALGAAGAHIEIVVDGALERGDCLVDGDLGAVDGRMSTRLEELRRALAAEALEGRR